jgi:hypothetical protein
MLRSNAKALIDSGATDNFISPHVIELWKIPTRKLHRSKAIRNIDETPNKIGAVTEVVALSLRFKRKTHIQSFYVVDLGTDNILLGMPFLSTTNPDIDWKNKTISSEIEATTMDIIGSYKPLAENAIPGTTMRTNLEEKAIESFFDKYMNNNEEPNGVEFDNTFAPEPEVKETTYTFVNTFAPNDDLVVRRTTKSTTLAAQHADKTQCTWQQQVPTKYHKYGKVFSGEGLQCFPKQHHWDHAIDLISDTPPMLDCKTYPLPEGQQKALDIFLAENLKKGYIRVRICPTHHHSFSPKRKMVNSDQSKTIAGSMSSPFGTLIPFLSLKS